jgi:hypothetical protein
VPRSKAVNYLARDLFAGFDEVFDHVRLGKGDASLPPAMLRLTDAGS